MGQDKNEKQEDVNVEAKDETSKEKRDREIEEAKKEMEDLMKSIQDHMGGEDVKVVKIKIPQPTFKQFIIDFITALLVNTLLIIGTNGFISFVIWESILDLVLFSVYFTVVEKVLNFILLRYFSPLIIKSMGLALFIPSALAIGLVVIFPGVVLIKNIVYAALALVFILVCRNLINGYIQKIINKKLYRRKK